MKGAEHIPSVIDIDETGMMAKNPTVVKDIEAAQPTDQSVVIGYVDIAYLCHPTKVVVKDRYVLYLDHSTKIIELYKGVIIET